MPNCFSLTPKGSTEPIVLTELDRLLCEHFGEPVHPQFWFRGWYNCIGFDLALGKSYNEIREFYKDDLDLIDVLNYIEKNYDARAWVEVGWHK